MQKIWNETFGLLRDHPELFLPVLIADLLTFFLRSLQRIVTAHLVHWIATTHSVLGGPALRSQIPYVKLMLMGVALRFISTYASVFLYGAALLVVAGRIGRLPAYRTLPRSSADRHDLLRFSLLAMLMCVASMLLTTLPLTLPGYLGRGDLSARPWFVPLSILPSYFLATWVLAPMAVALLLHRKLTKVADETRRESRLAGIGVSLAIALMILLLNVAPFPAPATEVGLFARTAFVSLTGALPYAVLFVALTLIAFRETDAAALADVVPESDGLQDA